MEVYYIVRGHDISFVRYYCNSNISEGIIRFLQHPLAKFFVNYHLSVLVALMHLCSDSLLY